jgi:signal transduction histidine kinase
MAFATDQERELANLLISVMHARDQEGARISRILHDEVGQILSAIGLQLDLLRMDLKENVEAASPRIAEIQRVLETAVDQVRDLSYESNPSIVERTGLPFALDRLVGRYRKGYSGSIRLLYDSSVHVPTEPATALYKIAEQAVDNAIAHSGGAQIEILVKPTRGGVALVVRDNGKGFSLEQESTGLGLHLMTYQAVQAGLQFSVASAPEKGTIVRAIYRSAK